MLPPIHCVQPRDSNSNYIRQGYFHRHSGAKVIIAGGLKKVGAQKNSHLDEQRPKIKSIGFK